MTFKPSTTPTAHDLRELYRLMGVEALASHLVAVVQALEDAGVEITDAARIGLDEIGEAVAENHARHNPQALRRLIAQDTIDILFNSAANARTAP